MPTLNEPVAIDSEWDKQPIHNSSSVHRDYFLEGLSSTVPSKVQECIHDKLWSVAVPEIMHHNDKMAVIPRLNRLIPGNVMANVCSLSHVFGNIMCIVYMVFIKVL